ncbi:MAG: hypothetical protein Q8M92_04270 [Candidatus Subteraquimicrobiales bacterium]|nr:hypothetical protein [Candidatus Subteraquimicrobiales bacterium]
MNSRYPGRIIAGGSVYIGDHFATIEDAWVAFLDTKKERRDEDDA